MRLTLTALAAGLALLASTRAGAEILYATNGSLISRFDSTLPGFVINVPVTGLQAGETLVGIDVRPGTTTLYGVGSSNRMYTLNPVTGAATGVGAGTFSTALSGQYFGMGFNPVPDLEGRNVARVVSDTEQNVRLDPDAGALVRVDSALNPAGYVVGVSYDRNYRRLSGDTTPTTLYGIDSAAGTLVTIGGFNGPLPGPSGGGVGTVGSLFLGQGLGQDIGFDISGVGSSAANPFGGTAYALIVSVPDGGVSRLFTINLSTGNALRVGDIETGPTPAPFHGLAAAELRRLNGDANLDGFVNGTDFALLAQNFGRSGTVDWGKGDFNADASVNGTDFALLAANFGKSGAGSTGLSAGAAAGRSGDDWEALQTFGTAIGVPVPEPTTAALLPAGAAGLLARRRRRG